PRMLSRKIRTLASTATRTGASPTAMKIHSEVGSSRTVILRTVHIWARRPGSLGAFAVLVRAMASILRGAATSLVRSATTAHHRVLSPFAFAYGGSRRCGGHAGGVIGIDAPAATALRIAAAMWRVRGEHVARLVDVH